MQNKMLAENSIIMSDPTTQREYKFSGLLYFQLLPLFIIVLNLFPHQFSCGCVCGQPPWKPPWLWSRLATRPSGRLPQGRFPLGRRWRRSCCSWARPQCPDACGQCSFPWSPEWGKHRAAQVWFTSELCIEGLKLFVFPLWYVLVRRAITTSRWRNNKSQTQAENAALFCWCFFLVC